MNNDFTKNITAHKTLEEQLRKLSCAVEQSPMTVVITDTMGTIEYVNPKFVQLTGYTQEGSVGKNPRILKSGMTSPEEYRQLVKAMVAMAHELGKHVTAEFVGDEKTLQLLKEYGVDYAQGYHVGVPNEWDKIIRT